MAVERANNTVLVIGGGGREQALAWKLAQSPHVSNVLMAPGNAGSEYLSQLTGKPITNIDIYDDQIGKVVDLARKHDAFVVVGPEAWLERGLGDSLERKNIAAIAPPEAQAKLELSKAWTRSQCDHWGIPQPKFQIFDDPQDAIDSIPETVNHLVVKVDGPAGGKGVTVCNTHEEIIEALQTAKERFGKSANQIILEERLYGTEVSYIVIADGTDRPIVLPPVRDYKRLRDGDTGPNTGSMGAYAPNTILTTEDAAQIEREIIKPVLRKMSKNETPYKGILYAGVMLTDEGPKLLEFNCRFGDPETQAQLPLFPYDLYEILNVAATGKFTPDAFSSNAFHGEPFPKASCVIVLAAEGYPNDSKFGRTIQGLETAQNFSNGRSSMIFHAGTRADGEKIVTNGGRVLNVVGTGQTQEQATVSAYKVLYNHLRFDGMQYRTDIGTT